MGKAFEEQLPGATSPRRLPGRREPKTASAATVGDGLRARRPGRSNATCETAVGRLIGFDGGGAALVELPDDADGGPIAARTTVSLGMAQLGREVVLVFDRGDRRKPVVLGVLQEPGEAPAAVKSRASSDSLGEPRVVEVPGKRLVFTAETEIVLRCGEASITLTRAGKVLIRGAYVLSRSSGENRIKGASIQIN